MVRYNKVNVLEIQLSVYGTRCESKRTSRLNMDSEPFYIVMLLWTARL